MPKRETLNQGVNRAIRYVYERITLCWLRGEHRWHTVDPNSDLGRQDVFKMCVRCPAVIRWACPANGVLPYDSAKAKWQRGEIPTDY